MNVEDTVGIPFQKNQTLSAREVGDIVYELFEYVDQSDATLRIRELKLAVIAPILETNDNTQ